MCQPRISVNLGPVLSFCCWNKSEWSQNQIHPTGAVLECSHAPSLDRRIQHSKKGEQVKLPVKALCYYWVSWWEFPASLVLSCNRAPFPYSPLHIPEQSKRWISAIQECGSLPPMLSSFSNENNKRVSWCSKLHQSITFAVFWHFCFLTLIQAGGFMVNFAFSFSPHTNCKRTEKLSRNVSQKCSVQKDGEKLLCFSVVLCMVCMQLFNQGIMSPCQRQDRWF